MAESAESAPRRGPGSKRKRGGKGKLSKAIHSTVWQLEGSSSWHCILDFLNTFGSHLQFNRSTFKEFLWKAVLWQRKEDSEEGPSTDQHTEDVEQHDWRSSPNCVHTEDAEQQHMQHALDSIPESMLEQLDHEASVERVQEASGCSVAKPAESSDSDCEDGKKVLQGVWGWVSQAQANAAQSMQPSSSSGSSLQPVSARCPLPDFSRTLRPDTKVGWHCLTTSLWNTKKNLWKLQDSKYGMCEAAGMASEVGEQDLELLKQFYTRRGLPGVFEEMVFTEHGGKNVQADVIVRIKEGPPLAAGIEEAAHGCSIYNLGSLIVNGPQIGPKAASKHGRKKYGFYCYRMPLFHKNWHYASFVSLFGNGTLVGVVLLLRVNLSLQLEGYAASKDQWSMHNLKGVHITGLHFRLIKQNILDMKPKPTLQFLTEVGWDPRLEMPFPVDI